MNQGLVSCLRQHFGTAWATSNYRVCDPSQQVAIESKYKTSTGADRQSTTKQHPSSLAILVAPLNIHTPPLMFARVRQRSCQQLLSVSEQLLRHRAGRWERTRTVCGEEQKGRRGRTLRFLRRPASGAHPPAGHPSRCSVSVASPQLTVTCILVCVRLCTLTTLLGKLGI
jgi:hypothetical protein